jgi:hypothetical protein
MFGIEWMRLLTRRPQVEIETYRMRNGNVLVLTFVEFKGLYEVTIYNRSDIEERTWEFHEEAEAHRKFNEVKVADKSGVDRSGAKR